MNENREERNLHVPHTARGGCAACSRMHHPGSRGAARRLAAHPIPRQTISPKGGAR
ncbi:hypothetical protein [Streptomyces corynorhini]|uniref:hypothetical protein n=1 Tax=Streptomyces corynorhini TaxID=2282652 RepID=UPI00131401F4|nr:hypothetical protein [Streptomyces corynorhini]